MPLLFVWFLKLKLLLNGQNFDPPYVAISSIKCIIKVLANIL